jgi:glycosyltransferase involved in cell wall biosynthesis
LYDQVDRLGLRRLIHFTGYVPVEDLPAIYNLGEFFVFPSLYEGFGLPVVEAMACGTPVITANTSSLDEIGAGAAETVDPQNVEALLEAIVALASDADRRRDLRQRGLARAQQFSWSRTAKEMLALYNRAAGFAVPHGAATSQPPELEAVGVKSVSPGALS